MFKVKNIDFLSTFCFIQSKISEKCRSDCEWNCWGIWWGSFYVAETECLQ